MEQAIARYESDGHEATIEYYNTPESIDGQWYVFIGDENDVMIAHAAVPENVGKPFDDVISPADGYPAERRSLRQQSTGARGRRTPTSMRRPVMWRPSILGLLDTTA